MNILQADEGRKSRKKTKHHNAPGFSMRLFVAEAPLYGIYCKPMTADNIAKRRSIIRIPLGLFAI